MTDTEILDWVIENLGIVTDGVVYDVGCGCCSGHFVALHEAPKLLTDRESLIQAANSKQW